MVFDDISNSDSCTYNKSEVLELVRELIEANVEKTSTSDSGSCNKGEAVALVGKLIESSDESVGDGGGNAFVADLFRVFEYEL